MTKIAIEKEKLDLLASVISEASGETLPLTLNEITAVASTSGIEGTPVAIKGAVSNHSVTVTPSVTNTAGFIVGGTKTGTGVSVSASELVSETLYCDDAGNWNVTTAATFVVPEANCIATNLSSSFKTENNTRKWEASWAAYGEDAGWVGEGEINRNSQTFNAVPSNTIIAPSTSAQIVGGVNYMMEGPITIAAIPTGTAGTPIATKGAVNNHSITITPSVTNTAGYIAGGTKTGTGVSVSASELVSGSETKTQNGTYDVTNLAQLVVAVSGGSPTLITKNITANGTYNASSDNADGYSSVTVNVSGGASNIIQGEFTAGTAGSVQTISLPYTGNGYITSLFIYVKGGIYDSNSIDNPTWYNLAHQNATAQWFMSKSSVQTEPNYTENNYLKNGCSFVYVYKSTSATSYTRTINAYSVLYSGTDPSANSSNVLFIPSATQLKIYVSTGSGTYGFVSGIKYSYFVVYSG